MPVLSLHYRSPEGRPFDLDYYRNRHLPLVRRVWGSYLQRIEVLVGTARLDGPSAVPFCVTALLYFTSDADLKAALAHPESQWLSQDIAHFTSIPPEAQFNSLLEPVGPAVDDQ